MRSVPLKVYGNIAPVDTALYAALAQACASALPETDDLPVLTREGDMARISFEGVFFPVEDVLAAMAEHLHPPHKGKLDVLDLEAWRLDRHTIAEGRITHRSASLNHVLDYAGH